MVATEEKGAQKSLFDLFDSLEKSIGQYATARKNPLLVLYWSEEGEITDFDVTLVEEALGGFCERNGIEKIKELDVIIQTRGGHVNASYLLAQTIRGFASKVNIIVPRHAYSGGTMISLCGDKIMMNRSSRLSLIDVQVGGSMGLIDIEKYVEFIVHSCDIAKLNDPENRFPVLIELMKELVKKVSPLRLGDFFRRRSLSEYYARILLLDYMLKTDSARTEKVKDIIERLTSESPTHSLDMDYNIVRGIGLKVELMEEKINKLAKFILDRCFDLEKAGLICEYPSRDCSVKMPFIEVFDEKGELK